MIRVDCVQLCDKPITYIDDSTVSFVSTLRDCLEAKELWTKEDEFEHSDLPKLIAIGNNRYLVKYYEPEFFSSLNFWPTMRSPAIRFSEINEELSDDEPLNISTRAQFSLVFSKPGDYSIYIIADDGVILQMHGALFFDSENEDPSRGAGGKGALILNAANGCREVTGSFQVNCGCSTVCVKLHHFSKWGSAILQVKLAIGRYSLANKHKFLDLDDKKLSKRVTVLPGCNLTGLCDDNHSTNKSRRGSASASL